MFFRQIYEPRLSQYAYLIGCQRSGEALIVDPMRDVDRYLALAEEEGLRITAATETHIHADYLSGTRQLAAAGVRVYLSDEGGEGWRYGWALKKQEQGQRENGDNHPVLLKDGDTIQVGNIVVEARHTPGHTPEHMSFLVTDHGGGADEPMGILSGDFVFVGDLGRPDLLESAAGQAGAMRPAAANLFRSVQGFLQLPDFMQVWPGHGAGSACGKALGAVPESTVGYEKRFNPAILAARQGVDVFVENILAGQPEPPLYFGRMKELNREGPPLLEGLPKPPRLAISPEMATGAGDSGKSDSGEGDDGLVIVDTRERHDFMASHLPGSLSAPFSRSFPTIAGSYVRPDQAMILVIDEANLDEAVRELVRIGLDNVQGYVEPAALQAHADAGGRMDSIQAVRFADLKDHVVLDVRRRAEFDEGHVEGARNIAHTRLLARLDELADVDGPLAVHCQTGVRAAAAASVLAARGFEVSWVDDDFARRS